MNALLQDGLVDWLSAPFPYIAELRTHKTCSGRLEPPSVDIDRFSKDRARIDELNLANWNFDDVV
jgi:hypothetical protein